MIKNSLYRYGDEDGRVPAHMHFGKEVFDNMLRNKDIVALTAPVHEHDACVSIIKLNHYVGNLATQHTTPPSAGHFSEHDRLVLPGNGQIHSGTDERMTYGEFAQMTADIALSLNHIGIGKGHVVSICSEKRFEFLPTVQGIICAGATFSPMDPTYGSAPLLHRVKIARPKIMFCSVSAYDTHKETFEEVGSIQKFILYGDGHREGAVLLKNFLTETTKLEDFQPVPVNGWEDNVFLVFSSGTTGLPKGVPVTHLAFLVNSQTTITREDHTGVCMLNTREWYYTYGMLYSLACLRVAATIVYNPTGGEKEMLEAVQKYKIKVMQLAPVIITELIKSSILDNYDVTSVEYIVSSSTGIREEAVNAIKKRFPNLVSVLQLYGMSEGGSICNEMAAPKRSKAGSSGVPTLGFVIKVVDLDTRKPLGPNQRGEICIKGPGVMKAYLNNICPDCKDEEGFLKSGDIGYYNKDGYFFIVNRIKELIKFNDISIAPAEFEALLLQHPSVREAGVMGKPHPAHGEVPVAFVVLQSSCSVTEDELVHHVNSGVTFRMRLAGGVRIVERLPRGAGDKLDRQQLRRWLDEEDSNKLTAV